MEFNYNEYLVRITFNPADIIVRFEHNKTHRCYEQTFFERDFPQTSMMGGMKFLEKILMAVFSAPKFGEIYINNFEESSATIKFNVVLNNTLFANPIVLPFEIQALRKQTGNIELGELNRKIKEMDLRMKTLLEEKLSVIDELADQVKELENRCGNSITVPGCIFAIPDSLTSLILVRDQTCLPDGRAFATMMPNRSTQGNWNNGQVNWNNMFQGSQQIGMSVSWQVVPEGFAFDKLTSIRSLKYLENCKQLTISGSTELQDYSPLGEMTWVTHLTIVSSRRFEHSNNTWVNAGNNPRLTDLKWIKNLKNLQSLTLLGCNQLSDITPLKDLPNLRELDIRETAVRNTDFLINPNLKITK